MDIGRSYQETRENRLLRKHSARHAMKWCSRLVVAVLFIWTLLPIGARADAESPKNVIDNYHAVILAAMEKAKQLGFEGRFKMLDPVITKSFDLALMARYTVGRYWNGMLPEQQERLVKDFAKFSVANFADRFDDYSGERFETLKEQTTSRGDVIVFTAIDKPDGDQVKINYILRKEDDHWRIIDVFFEGSISELATRRSEYSAVILNHGVDQLLTLIEQKTADLAKPK